MTRIEDRAAELEAQNSAADLSTLARDLEVTGRGSMSKRELALAVAAAEIAVGEEPPTFPDATVTIAGQSHAVDEPAEVLADAERELQPGTPEEVGRSDLLEIATSRAADRRPAVVIGEDPEDPTPTTTEEN